MDRVPAAARKRAIAVLALATLVLLSAWEVYLYAADKNDHPDQRIQLAVDSVRRPAADNERRVIVMGSSRAFCGINPDIVRNQLGVGWDVRLAAMPAGSGPAQLHVSHDYLVDGDVVVVECLALAAYTNFRSNWQIEFDKRVGNAHAGQLERQIMEPLRASLLFVRGRTSPAEEARRWLRGALQMEPARELRNVGPEGAVNHDNGWLEFDGGFQPDMADSVLQFQRKTVPEDRMTRFSRVAEVLRRDVRTLEDRGVTVVLLRMPSEGNYAADEEQLFPRAQYWNRFAQVAPGRAWHFSDFEATRDLRTWDNQHLTADSARIYSRWLGAKLRGLVEDNSR